MGIPKFFRYISERYPLTSQLIQENKIPEFDNLYLDFNGIIHNCSHPNDEDAHFRITEEQIFTSIFTYVDHLFEKIKPKKLFFLAIDGVAPRAKMNQQRSRRFRTAKEAKEAKQKALAKGEELPKEAAFDSNCITPGTVFMAKLSEQLRYFINKKITEDSNWRDVQVVLSGHDVPGEGEHKIMEYIRLHKAQPEYNPNTRHCFYGLDADLIMLGLTSHDPHFALLREEVKFGPSRKSKGPKNAENTNYYLLHLTLMREYMDLEFREIEPILPFDYNLERVIDDFILLAVFVGNDFLPHLPDLHIHENGLERLFEVYKKALPSLGGYINDRGKIDTRRLQIVLDEMRIWEQEVFEREYADLNWYKGKQSKHVKEMEVARKKAGNVLTVPQKDIFEKVQAFVLQHRGASPAVIQKATLTMPNTFPARERTFIHKLADDLHLTLTWDEYDQDDQNLVTWRLPGALTEPPPIDDDDDDDDGEWSDQDDGDESRAAVDRVLKKYAKAPVMSEDGEGDFDRRHDAALITKMDEWKRGYYKGKLEIDYDDPQQMNALIFRYVEGLQWVMHYYFSGVPSWSWFYDYHYAPRISDLRGIEQLNFSFDLGKPFRPFEQLMGVLPAASQGLIPPAYRSLMDNPDSPLLDFYPLEFEQDMNGKKQEWEAIVKIPFIDEKRLLGAMATREGNLTQDERNRNAFGTSIAFKYDPDRVTSYPSSLPGFFPPIVKCTCIMEPFYLPTMDGLHYVPGLLEGVLLGAEALAGFPSLNTLPHFATIGVHGVNVHGSESRNKSIIVHIKNPHEGRKTEDIARDFIGTRVYVGWPFLGEGEVYAVSDSLFNYEKIHVVAGGPEKIIPNPHSQRGLGLWKSKADQAQYTYSKRSGVLTGDVDVLLHVRPLRGLKRLDDGSFVKDFEGQDKEVECPVQMSLSQVASQDPRFMERAAPPLSEEFPEGSKIFFLGEHAYGVAASVNSTADNALSIILAFFPSDANENARFKQIVSGRPSSEYYPAFKVASVLHMTGRALSRITSSFLVITNNNQKVNLGLNIKFEAKSLKVVGYSRKNDRYWEYSQKTIDLLKEYQAKYPTVFQGLDDNGDNMSRSTDLFPTADADAKVQEIKGWLKSKGIGDFDAVSLFCDQLDKDTCADVQKLADELSGSKSLSAIKKAVVKGIPRQAVLKPSHAMYRLQGQRFALGDRVTMVQDSGGVPLAVKGVVIGLNSKTMDVLWDTPFMAGTTMGGRCSEYRGSTVEFNTCLNLTDRQYITSMKPRPPQAEPQTSAFKPRNGPYPAVQPAPGHQAASGFRPAPAPRGGMQIMSNPNRGRGAQPNGRGGSYAGAGRGANVSSAPTPASATKDGPSSSPIETGAANGTPNGFRGRGGFRGGRGGGGGRGGRGGGGLNPEFDRGRGARGGPRGRGRGLAAA